MPDGQGGSVRASEVAFRAELIETGLRATTCRRRRPRGGPGRGRARGRTRALSRVGVRLNADHSGGSEYLGAVNASAGVKRRPVAGRTEARGRLRGVPRRGFATAGQRESTAAVCLLANRASRQAVSRIPDMGRTCAKTPVEPKKIRCCRTLHAAGVWGDVPILAPKRRPGDAPERERPGAAAGCARKPGRPPLRRFTAAHVFTAQTIGRMSVRPRGRTVGSDGTRAGPPARGGQRHLVRRRDGPPVRTGRDRFLASGAGPIGPPAGFGNGRSRHG